MNQKEIHTYPDPVLKARAEVVTEIDAEIQALIDAMTEIMYSAPGIGLAANQVGVLKRVIVFDRTPKDRERDPVALINPEIVLSEDEIKWEEACLSVPDFTAEVVRNGRVKVRGIDREGNPLDIEAEDLLGVCLQHEIDHLDGILFIDRISTLKRALYKKKLKKKLKGK
ncbi:MAG: peptide deformylase [Deltaproteobacteria bacterium]|nr:peptide deformylase [Deltaproteobacteria bacterium]MBW2048888.1 peptide deformylase [Deltaproteobacteria bacterium]MBW2110720.1 peptide deformylase [Deltaproteobacteria bacterium]HDZ91769.1 peptide deformylase [Deltaproteobacteria bacterium]